MRASHSLAALSLLAAGTAGSAAAHAASRAAASESQPFGVQDLVRLDRISEVAASPDGQRIAYTLRTTDMEANKGRTSIWVLDVRRRKATEARITDPASNASSAEWSSDGRFLYFLSNRGGTMQVWRASLERKRGELEEPQPVTHLPLEVGTFRISPRSDRLIVSLEVFPECADLPCTQQRLDAAKTAPAHGVLYSTIFARHWDTWSDGRRSQLFSLAFDASGAASGEPDGTRITQGSRISSAVSKGPSGSGGMTKLRSRSPRST